MLAGKTIRRLMWLVLIGQIALAAAAWPLQAEEPAGTAAGEAEQSLAPDPPEPEGVEGVAVYYARRYQGRRTHSGERFDHKRLTAAHPSLPHGTRVKLVNLANHRSVVVTVNDRCRKRRFEFIDVSRAAAKELGFLNRRVAKVKIIPLTEE